MCHGQVLGWVAKYKDGGGAGQMKSAACGGVDLVAEN